MLPRTYEGQNCSIARALEVIGERWTLLVVRECLEGTKRFDQFQAKLSIARNVLTARLRLLEEEGILRKRAYQEKPTRYEYLLTRKGLDLQPIVLTLMAWGDRYAAPDGPPLVLRHACGTELEAACTCASCGDAITPGSLRARPGPGWKRTTTSPTEAPAQSAHAA